MGKQARGGATLTQSKPSTITKSKRLKRPFLIAAIGFFLLIVSAVITAYKFDMIGFLDPDTCWILALGKNIWEHRAVPATDPFSFTLPLSAAVGMPQPFVVHQWLFDLLCYALFRSGRLLAIAAFCAALSAMAFVTIPWRICLRAKARPLAVYTISLCTGLSATLRSYVRPELASCFCMALWLVLLQQLRTEAELVAVSKDSVKTLKLKISWKLVVCFSLVMLLWCNLHTGFVSGLGILAVVVLSLVLQDVFCNKKLSGPTATGLLAMGASFLATLINPVGIKLWQFLPTLFGLTRYFWIREMLPIQQEDFLNPEFAPFLIMVAISVGSVLFYARKKAAERLSLLSPIRLGSVVLMVAAIWSASQVWRLVPFSTLILAMEAATLLGGNKPGISRPYWTASPVTVLLRKRFPKGYKFNLLWDFLPPIAGALGVILMANKFNALTLPQSSMNLSPPVRAIQFLMKNPQSGPLFNEALIGSMMTWYLPQVKVFVDTRFDQYGQGILSDYQSVVFRQHGAGAVLDTYGIEWIFVGAEHPLAAALKKAPKWAIIYEDDDALIFRRKDKLR